MPCTGTSTGQELLSSATTLKSCVFTREASTTVTSSPFDFDKSYFHEETPELQTRPATDFQLENGGGEPEQAANMHTNRPLMYIHLQQQKG